jgi:hypothetical protein
MIISGNIPWHGQIKPLWMPKPLSLPYPFLSIQNTKKKNYTNFRSATVPCSQELKRQHITTSQKPEANNSII